MKRFGEFVCKHKTIILIITLLLLIPSIIGMKATKINYDILVYLPKDIETMKGEQILTDDFNMGAYSISIIDNMDAKDVLKLEDEIRDIDGVNKVESLYDVVGTTIPIEMLTSEVTKRLAKGDSSLMFITFNEGTSEEKTLSAVEEIRKITKDDVKVSGMSAMVLDTMNLSDQEITAYVLIAVALCLLVLTLSLDSYAVPVILLINIGIAILFNMGTNVFLGNISYITKAISAVLQLGVTTDFSIFLYHKYEKAKKEYKDNNEAMANAIKETITSVLGSSLTTIAGFLALCAMTLTLGKDIGIVMAKGVLFGVICVVTVFPSLLLSLDKIITKTTHKELLPKFNHIKDFTIKHYKAIFIVFLILLIPAWYGQMNTKVYYNLDRTLPSTLKSSVANTSLKDEYNIVSPEIILINKNIDNDKINDMMSEIKKIKGIDFAISYSSIDELGLPTEMLDKDLTSMLESDKYKLVLINSTYDIATNKLNNQIDKVNEVVKKYDKNAIVAGEGPLMKDLVQISDTDFNNVTYVSVVVIIIIMIFVLKSFSLPLLLTGVIEFAIFVNMAIAYYTGTTIPFISSIVIGTIQLGATIDYAILMTTKYLEERKSGSDKFVAVRTAMDNSVNSIFVSGMCFFAATFGVAMYSKLELIGSICTLISRGALISMVTVIMVLPSVLIIFDKLIMKTTKTLKKGEKKMNKKIVKAMSVLLIGTMLIIPTSVFALEKDETVYAKLKSNGSVKKVIVTEHLINNNKESGLTDLTDLNNIYNVNGNEKSKLDNNTITWNNKSNKDIYYQGTSTKELPIEVNVTYKLNGKQMSAKKMVGKKGNVEIIIKYFNKDKHIVNGNTLYTPFVIGMSTTISAKNNSNIMVTNGKVVSTGTNNVIAAVAAPGLYESMKMEELQGLDEITISYETTKFSMNSIYSAATAKVLDSSDLDKLDNLDGVYDKINTLTTSSQKLVSGSNDLKDATNKAYEGSVQIESAVNSSINSLKSDKTSALDSDTINAIGTQSSKAAEAKFTDEYKAAIGDAAVQSVDKNIQDSIHQLEGNRIDDSLVQICSSQSIPSQYQQTCASSAAYIKKYVALKNPEIVALMEDTARQTAIKTAEETAKQTAEETAKEVSKTVADEVKSAATTKTIDSLNTLASSLNTLSSGLKSINDGANELSSGLNKFNDEGISKVSDIVNNNLKEKVNKLNSLRTLSKSYNTFTLKDKSVTGTTKFIMLIDSVK